MLVVHLIWLKARGASAESAPRLWLWCSSNGTEGLEEQEEVAEQVAEEGGGFAGAADATASYPDQAGSSVALPLSPGPRGVADWRRAGLPRGAQRMGPRASGGAGAVRAGHLRDHGEPRWRNYTSTKNRNL